MDKQNKEKYENLLCDMTMYLCKEVFDIKYNGVININNRLKTTYGYFLGDIKSNTIPIISISPKVIESNNKYLITDILLHELTHWYVDVIGKDNSDDSDDFLRELARVGAKPSGIFNVDEEKYSPSFFTKEIRKYVKDMSKILRRYYKK